LPAAPHEPGNRAGGGQADPGFAAERPVVRRLHRATVAGAWPGGRRRRGGSSAPDGSAGHRGISGNRGGSGGGQLTPAAASSLVNGGTAWAGKRNREAGGGPGSGTRPRVQACLVRGNPGW